MNVARHPLDTMAAVLPDPGDGDRSMLVRALTDPGLADAPSSGQPGVTLQSVARRMSPERARLLVMSLVEHRTHIGLDLNEPALREVLEGLHRQGTLAKVAVLIENAARESWDRDLEIAERGQYAGVRYHRATYPALKLAGIIRTFEQGLLDGRPLSRLASAYGVLAASVPRLQRYLLPPATGTESDSARVRREAGMKKLQSCDLRQTVAAVLFASGVAEIVTILREIWHRSGVPLRSIIDDARDERVRAFLAEVYGSDRDPIGPYGASAPQRLRRAMIETSGLLETPGPSGVSQLDAMMDFLGHLHAGKSLDLVQTDKLVAVLADENPGTVIIRR